VSIFVGMLTTQFRTH